MTAKLQRISRHLLAAAGALLSVSFGGAAPVTIVTYNVENYLVTGRLVGGQYRPDYPKPEEEKAAVRRILVALAPDVVALQEMGPQPFLDELRQDLARDGLEFPFARVLEAGDPDRHVAVLSRLPLKALREHPVVTVAWPAPGARVKRGVFELTVPTDAGDVTLFIVHLKSRLTERGDDVGAERQRLAEAKAVHELVHREFPDPAVARYLVCGDWNDQRDSPPVRTLVGRGKTKLGEILPAADSRGEVWTHHFLREDSYSRIDFFLVSPALKSAVIGGCARIYDGPGVTEGSDHRPVVLKIEKPSTVALRP